MKKKKRNRRRKQKQVNTLLKGMIVFLFIAGVAVFFYPFLSDTINTFYANQMVAKIEKENKEQFLKEKKEQLKKAKEQQKKSDAKTMIGLREDLFDIGKNEVGSLSKEDYQKHLIGSVYIPKINIGIPLFDETTDTLLEQGATVLQGTSYPTGGENTHSVITGHSGLPKKKIFTDLEELNKGDYFLVNNSVETLKYEIISIKKVLPTETSDLVVQEGQDLVTLLTCTPYMINTHRLLVTGKRVPYTEKEAQKEIKQVKQNQSIYFYLLILVIILIVTLFCLWIRRLMFYSKKKKGKKRRVRK